MNRVHPKQKQNNILENNSIKNDSKNVRQVTMVSVFERVEPGARKANKRNILNSALACFNECGIEATTIEMIKERSDSSIGAIYHHFGNKEGLVAALFFAALSDQELLIREAMGSETSVKEAIQAIIHTYSHWVTEQPELARFMFRARALVSSGPHGEQLETRNKTVYSHLFALFKQAQQNGEINVLPTETIASILIGPAESYCRAWLAGRVTTPPQAHANTFAQAAWAAFSHQAH